MAEMTFPQINMSDEETRLKVMGFMELIRRINEAPNKQLSLTVVDIDTVVGTGQLGKLLRTVLSKVKGASNKGGVASGCIYEIDPFQFARFARVFKHSTQYEIAEVNYHEPYLQGIEEERRKIREQELEAERKAQAEMEEFRRWKETQ